MEEDEYKDTEIGKIPRDWEVIKLEEIFSPVNLNDRKVVIDPKKEYKLIKTTLYSKGVALKDVVEGKKIKAKFMYELKDNDFIFSKINLKKGALGFVGSELEGSVVSSEHPILKLNTEKAYKDYIKYYFYQPNVWSSLKAEAKGFSGKERIKIREFLLFKIVLPNFEEQKRIAYVLSKIENAIKIQDRIINSLQELKKSMMHKLFTEGIGHTEFKDTKIGRIPKEWEVLELGDEKITVFIKSGNTPSKEIQEYWNGDILFVTQRDMTKVSKYLYETSEKITELGLKNFNLFIIPENSILLSMYGTIGKVVINKNPVTVSQNIAAIKLNNKNADQEYFFYAIQYYSFQFKKKAKTSTMKHLNIKIVKQIYLPLPSLQEQQQIALIISNIDNKILIEVDRKKYFEALFKTILNKLMTGQIRVKNLEMRE